MLERITQIFSKNNDSNDQIIAKNAVYSLIARGLRAVFVFLQVRIVLEIIGKAEYGTWTTLFSVVTWLAVFDLGIAAGFRNRLVEALAEADTRRAHQLISTAYVSIGALFGGILLLFYISFAFLDWQAIMRLQSNSEGVNMAILVTFTCLTLNIITGLYNQILIAHNQTATSEVILCMGEGVVILIFCVVFLSGLRLSLLAIATIASAVPLLAMVGASAYGFGRQFRLTKPSFSLFRKDFVGLIADVGLKFFVIQLMSLVLHQSQNFFINDHFGPSSVTVFNTCYRYFSASALIFTALVAPFFPIFTKEYTLKNVEWLKMAKRKLLYIWGGMVVLLVVMLLCSTFVYPIWLGDQVQIPFEMSLAMTGWFIIYFFCAIFYHLLCSMSHLGVQAAVYVLAAGLCIFLFYEFSNRYGLVGVPASFCLVMGLNGLIMYWQVERQLAKLNTY